MDTDDALLGFLRFAKGRLKPHGRIVVVDGFRSDAFGMQHADVQMAMKLAESGFRIRRMASKQQWRALANTQGLHIMHDVDLTNEALPFWTLAWRIGQLVTLLPAWFLRRYFASSSARAETGANFISVMFTAYAMSLGSAAYGVLVLCGGHGRARAMHGPR